MRGSPILALAVVSLFLAWSGWGLYYLTLPKQPPVVAPQERPPPEEGVLLLEVISPLAPSHLAITEAGTMIFELEYPGPELHLEFSMVYPEFGSDWVVSAQWEDHLVGPKALLLRAHWNGNPLTEASYWGKEEIVDVWSLPAREGTP